MYCLDLDMVAPLRFASIIVPVATWGIVKIQPREHFPYRQS